MPASRGHTLLTSFLKYFLSTSYMPGSLLDTEDSFLPSGSLQSGGQACVKIITNHQLSCYEGKYRKLWEHMIEGPNSD